MAVDIKRVAENYNLSVHSVGRAKGAFALSTNEGIKLLMEYTKSEKKLELSEAMRLGLVSAGYTTVDTYMRATDGRLIVNDENQKNFVMKNWFEGRECDIYSDDEVDEAVEELAKIHIALGVITEDIKTRFNESIVASDEKERQVKHFRELKKATTYVRGKKLKNDFELLLSNNAGGFIEDGKNALGFLEENKDIWNGISIALCHGDYNHHNIMFDDDFVAITDLESGHMGYQIGDLYNFMRKVLEKRDYDENLGMRMYNTYDGIKKISKEEKKLMYACFLFPDKFWKVVNSYYNKKKTMFLQKNMEKLEMCIKQREARNIFARNLLHM